MNIALVIAVEEYKDDDISEVLFASNDANAFADAINAIGFEEEHQEVLINDQATKTTIKSKLKTIIGSLTEWDTFFLYYAGHGFSENNRNYLTCYDTIRDDLVDTSISLEFILKKLRKSKCKKSAIFLDACHSGKLVQDDMRGIFGDMTNDELNQFFDDSEHCICFASCKTGQYSYASRPNKHGAWTFNVLEAFRGNAPTALESGNHLTSNSLQNYLSQAVQRTLRQDYPKRKNQTPWMFGSSSSEFQLADLNELILARQTPANPNESQILDVSFAGRTVDWIKSLSGFIKGVHTVPKKVDSYTEDFARKVAHEEVKQDLKDTFNQLRSSFGFKRLDLEKSSVEEASGSIITPYFTYEVEVSLNPEDPSEVIWERRVTNIKEPQQILSVEFSQAFDRVFDTIEFSPPSEIDVRKLIDLIEDMDSDELTVGDFDEDDLSHCSISISGVADTIRVTEGTFSIVASKFDEPKNIFLSFVEVQKALVNKHDIRLIEFDRSDEEGS